MTELALRRLLWGLWLLHSLFPLSSFLTVPNLDSHMGGWAAGGRAGVSSSLQQECCTHVTV